MVHRGNIMGIRFYGEATEGDIRNLKNFADKLKDLQDALALLFNEGGIPVRITRDRFLRPLSARRRLTILRNEPDRNSNNRNRGDAE